VSILLGETAKGIKLWLMGFRKLLVTLIYIIVVVSLLVAGYLPKDTWLAEVSKVMIAYLATNSAEHILSAIKEHFKAKV
jgi:hypothetical protein